MPSESSSAQRGCGLEFFVTQFRDLMQAVAKIDACEEACVSMTECMLIMLSGYDDEWIHQGLGNKLLVAGYWLLEKTQRALVATNN